MTIVLLAPLTTRVAATAITRPAVIVLNKSDNELVVVDLNTKKITGRVPVAGGKLYFTSETSRVVARYDPVANVVDWVVGTGQATSHMICATADRHDDSRGPEGIDVSPDGTELWAAHSQDGGVSVIDLATKAVVAAFST